jgi:hypothetical protein
MSALFSLNYTFETRWIEHNYNFYIDEVLELAYSDALNHYIEVMDAYRVFSELNDEQSEAYATLRRIESTRLDRNRYILVLKRS